ncbi:hypothetical protein GWK47_049133 [Chionoecetes opilio]|uniref:Uncharacterized protein n=1 Tax=Chionoecetes opilio TaxID=41210 RepID=A0A8J5CFA6_CHIOP|nr:hypothetical protein GWK47_049133 [Chionoecetes opilio]
MYGRASKVTNVDDMRHLRINELCAKENRLLPSGNVDMASLPPCKRSLTQHIRRVNHQVRIWKRAHVPRPRIPKASQGHGWEEENGHMDPVWYEGNLLPRQLADIAQVAPDDADSGDDSSDSTCDEMEPAWERVMVMTVTMMSNVSSNEWGLLKFFLYNYYLCWFQQPAILSYISLNLLGRALYMFAPQVIGLTKGDHLNPVTSIRWQGRVGQTLPLHLPPPSNPTLSPLSIFAVLCVMVVAALAMPNPDADADPEASSWGGGHYNPPPQPQPRPPPRPHPPLHPLPRRPHHRAHRIPLQEPLRWSRPCQSSSLDTLCELGQVSCQIRSSAPSHSRRLEDLSGHIAGIACTRSGRVPLPSLPSLSGNIALLILVVRQRVPALSIFAVLCVMVVVTLAMPNPDADADPEASRWGGGHYNPPPPPQPQPHPPPRPHPPLHPLPRRPLHRAHRLPLQEPARLNNNNEPPAHLLLRIHQ